METGLELPKCLLGNHILIQSSFYFFYDSLKLLKWWAQSVLINTQNILCGIKDKSSATVHQVKTYKVQELPVLCSVSDEFFKQCVNSDLRP